MCVVSLTGNRVVMAVQFISSVFLFALFSHVYCDGAIKGLDQSDDGSSGTISFKTPELDDEDAYSFHMPSSLKCDGCRVIAHLVSAEVYVSILTMLLCCQTFVNCC